MKLYYNYITNEDLKIEKCQITEEGKDIRSVEKEFKLLLSKNLNNDISLQSRAGSLLDKTINLPIRRGYEFKEPSDLKEIRKLSMKKKRKIKGKLNDKILLDKVSGAWFGRCAGCLLGKPVEGWKSDKFWPFLKEQDKYPLSEYMSSNIRGKLVEKYSLNNNKAWINNVKHMIEDDDMNYTVTGFAVMKKHGKNFKPEDIANFWLANIPMLHTYSAERVAYKNFAIPSVPITKTASYRNVYREWIGAQIRADFFGYVAMGNPEQAAEYAWRDASISHVKNGIYGEMWVAAMLAAAPYTENVKEVMEVGLNEIQASSILFANIKEVISWYEEGIDNEEAIKRIHLKWNEDFSHHWCHTISNAQIIAMGLLWGQGNFETSICNAVQACFDTDCNGATVGSIMGMMYGAKKLPFKCIKPLNNELGTGIAGYYLVKISEIAKEGFMLYKKFR